MKSHLDLSQRAHRSTPPHESLRLWKGALPGLPDRNVGEIGGAGSRRGARDICASLSSHPLASGSGREDAITNKLLALGAANSPT